MRPTLPSCAVCAGDVVGTGFREPIGKDDALVLVCSRCATEDVVPKDIEATRPRAMRESSSEQYERVRAHRDQLKASGLCPNGASHQRPTEGNVYCASCRSRSQLRTARRDAGRRARRLAQ